MHGSHTTASPQGPPPLANTRDTLLLDSVPEIIAAALLAAAVVSAWVLMPSFGDIGYLADKSTVYVESGLMVLAMTLIIVAGHIDLSCASTLGLVGTLIAFCHVRLGIPLETMLVLAVPLGAALGAINGAAVAGLGLPSLVVTLATMALYRGVAQVLIGDHSLSLPQWFVGIDRITVAGTPLRLPLLVLLAAAIVLGLLLHRTVLGRWIVAMGTNSEAARYSGVPVGGVTFLLFVLSGAVSALGAVLMLSRLSVARYDHGAGLELSVVTAVVLGGASIYGGRGTIFGSMLAMLLVAVVQTGMGLGGIREDNQVTAIGALLVVAVIMSNLTSRLRR
jgi:rhamnose transport system permease protein